MFIKFTKVWFLLSGLAVGAAILLLTTLGLNLGIDFTGGSLLEVRFAAPVETKQIAEVLKATDLDLANTVVTPTDAGTQLLRLRYLTEAEREKLIQLLGQQIGSFTTEQFTAIGPTIGQNLRERAFRALTYAAIAIVLYLAATFRNPRQVNLLKYWLMGGLLAALAIILETIIAEAFPKLLTFLGLVATFGIFLVFEIRSKSPSLKFGLCAIVALAHDLLFTLGFLSLLGLFTGAEINSLTVTALLAIMGFSVNDTIVVFDRLRENLKFQKNSETLAEIGEKSLHQTLARSINTSVSTLLVLFLLLLFGAESIQNFVLTLSVGLTVGTYSSIFLATPLLVWWEMRQQKEGVARVGPGGPL